MTLRQASGALFFVAAWFVVIDVFVRLQDEESLQSYNAAVLAGCVAFRDAILAVAGAYTTPAHSEAVVSAFDAVATVSLPVSEGAIAKK
jgi:hypothetical protein